MNLDSVTKWDSESQRKFWNDWDARHLQDKTIGEDAIQRGNAVLELLRQCSPSPRILEIGCGNGWLSEKLLTFGPVTGVDIADTAIVEARQRVPAGTFFAGDAMNAGLQNESFDVVVTLETFSHVPDQDAFVALTSRLLTKGGYLIMTTQNRTICMRRTDIAPPAPGQLRRWVSMPELKTKLAPFFKIIEASTLKPAGSKGILRIINSRALNGLISKIIPAVDLVRLKEQCGLGQTLIVLAKKRD